MSKEVTLESIKSELDALKQDHTNMMAGFKNMMAGLNLLREGNLHFNAAILVAFEMIKSAWNADHPEEDHITDEMIQDKMNEALQILLDAGQKLSEERSQQIEKLQERVSPEARQALEALNV